MVVICNFENKIDAKFTAADKSGMHQYTFPSGKKGLYINACYGSRGFSFAPLSSLSLANLMDQSLNSDDKFLLGYLNPERRFFRGMGLKKQGIEFKL